MLTIRIDNSPAHSSSSGEAFQILIGCTAHSWASAVQGQNRATFQGIYHLALCLMLFAFFVQMSAVFLEGACITKCEPDSFNVGIYK